jgi:hypothetical protein
VAAGDDPLSLQAASNSNPKIDNTTLVIVPALIAQPDASQFHRAMISLDLAARHRMVRPAADMSDAFVLESLRSKQSPQPLPHRE